MSSDRLGAPYGRFLDRARPLTFSFEGGRYAAFQWDTIASGLAAGGRSVLSRSFKYHRPRGILGMAGHDVNAFMQIGAEPNVHRALAAGASGFVLKNCAPD